MRSGGAFEYAKKRFHPGHHQELVLRPQRLLKLAKLWQATGTLSYSRLLMHMVLGRWEEGRCFYIFFTGVDPVRVLGHGPVLGVVAVVDLGWTFGWTCGARKVALPHLRRPWSLYWCA